MMWPAYTTAHMVWEGVTLSRWSLPDLGPKYWSVRHERKRVVSELRFSPPRHRSLVRIFTFLDEQDIETSPLNKAWPVISICALSNLLAKNQQSMRAYIALISDYTYAEGDYFTGYRERILRYKADILKAEHTLVGQPDAGESLYQEIAGCLPEGVPEVPDR